MAYLGNNNLPFDPTRTSPAPRDADRFSGNGSTVAFTLSRSVALAVDIEVFVENVQQEPITAYDVNGTTLTFTGAPPSGTNNVYVVYRNFQNGAQVTVPDGSITYSKLANNIRIFTTDNLTPNGNNSVFTLSEPPADANTVMVTVDGIIQRAPVHYTTSGSTITFTSAPAAGSNVHVRHLGFRTTATVTQLAANSTITTPTLAGTITTSSAVFTGNVGFQGKIAAAQVGYTPSFSTASITSDGVNAGASFRARHAANTATRSDWGVTNEFRTYINSYDDPGSTYKPLDIAANLVNFYTGTSVLGLNAAIDDSGVLKFNSGYGSAGAAYGCRAWVNFNGTGTVAIRGSGNVSSITDNGGGDYTVNFTTSMPDANYCGVARGDRNSNSTTDMNNSQLLHTYATGSVRLKTGYPGGINTLDDSLVTTVAIFR